MSPKNSLLATGLTALGLFGFAPPGVADPAAAPSGSPTSVAPSPSRAVLLLTNGQVIQGLVSEDRTSYVVHRKEGKIPYPRTHVERAFRTVGEAYEYKVSRLPDRDPDEHMKLAQWCLTNALNAEAKIQLRAVIALSPKHPRAIAMLGKIEGAEDRAALRDPGVMRTGAEVVENRAATLNPAILGRASREMGISALPQIPGLPTSLAVKRTDEFARNIHPILQMYCARCHNDNYPGDFRLISFKAKQDRTTDALRANLDATLRLVLLEDPAKSELLSSTLRPHGSGSKPRPIFLGSNDRAYRILAAWVNSLRPPKTPDELQPSRFGLRETSGSGEERFAGQRASTVPLPLTPTASVSGSVAGAAMRLTPPTTPTEASFAPPGTEFPLPYLEGGPKPQQASAAAPERAGQPAAAAGRPTGNRDDTLPPLPIDPAAPPGEAASAPAPKRPTKPVKIDPAILQRALMNRFNPPQ